MGGTNHFSSLEIIILVKVRINVRGRDRENICEAAAHKIQLLYKLLNNEQPNRYLFQKYCHKCNGIFTL